MAPLTLIVSLEAIFLSALVIIAQNALELVAIWACSAAAVMLQG